MAVLVTAGRAARQVGGVRSAVFELMPSSVAVLVLTPCRAAVRLPTRLSMPTL